MGTDFFIKEKLNSFFVLYQGHHNDKNANQANIIFPGASFLEKTSHYLNISGMVQKTNLVLNLKEQIRNDWKILVALSLYLNNTLTFNKLDNLILNDLKLLLLKHSYLFLNFQKEFKSSLKFSKHQNKVKTKIYNTFLFFKDRLFFLNNSFTRASKVLSLCQLNFNQHFFNFKL